jgi:hypothetical protein
MSTFDKIVGLAPTVSSCAKAVWKFITSYAKTFAIILFLALLGIWSFGRGVATGAAENARLAAQIVQINGDLELARIVAGLHKGQADYTNRKLEELGRVQENAAARLAAQQNENAALQKKVEDYVSKLGKSKDGKRAACALSPDDVRGLLSIQ